MSSETIIKIEELCKTHKGASEAAINNITLDINRNEVFGLLGPNGAGKTTTISILCGLYSASSGKVSIDHLTYQQHAEQIKRIIGVVPQDIALYPSLTAKENLRFFGNMYGISGADLEKRMDQFLENFELAEHANKRILKMSGGMKRRVNLIAGILHQPKILFLDEPTVGIDVHSRSLIIQHLKKINQAGTTIIYTSHHMEEAENFCSQVAIIDRGKIIAKGSPKELVASNPKFRKMEDVFLNLTDVPLSY
ncbi:MAG TPA: ABC transporter ATP-binding protein [Bacteroidia bacterium]|nr:ABC transporter ATP-binding protein [Bacteroidia bacterium]HRH07814.1 ABC transporter ATP-binding protein [Bacteroidia bacterium]HRH61812.1 ABC transporter ATP-binding protein [Bacteroidia bacterium]